MKEFLYKIKNIIRWIPIIWKDYDWDYCFMLRLEYEKLKNMVHWYETNNYGHCVNGKHVCMTMKWALNCLDIILNGDWWTIDWPDKIDWTTPGEDHEKYYIIKPHINIKNWKRFMPYMKQEQLDMHPKQWSIELYECKAWSLYNKIREQYMREWWD